MLNTLKAKALNTTRLANTDVEVCQVAAPLTPDAAWKVESLLLKIFEYGDYSLRSALLGEYSETLNCTFFLAEYKGELVGAAACLYAHRNPTIAIVGPVGVDSDYRGNGIGTKLVRSLIKHLRLQRCMVAYLGVSANTPSASLYERLGFKRYQGIVMRLLLTSRAEFERGYFTKCTDVRVRRAVWGDFPAIQALVSFPCQMYTVDIRRGIFSSRYVEPTKFLSVFPAMMRTFAKHGGFAKVLVANGDQTVVGVAHINRLPSKTQKHMAELDFFVHDNFTSEARRLLHASMKQASDLSVEKIHCCCLRCDHLKRQVIEELEGKQIAVLPGNVFIDGKYEDVLVHQL